VRILSLTMVAFGALEGVRIPFDGGSHGLSVLYGANEAGKSTTLRAIEAVLFGFPPQTRDNFRFAYPDLAVGAHLRFEDGLELELVRRKRKQSALLGPDGSPLDDAPLKRALRGLDASSFAMELGIDQQRLRAGAQALLHAKGDAAQALFSAGLGGTGIKEMLSQLEDEADRLFKRKKRTGILLSQLAAYDGAIKRQRDAAASADDHAKTEADLAAAANERDAALADAKTRRDRVARLDKRISARPDAAERRELRRRLGELSGVALLAPDFDKRRRDAQERRRVAEAEASRALAAMRERHDQLAALPHDEALLADKGAIVDLERELAVYERDLRDAPVFERDRELNQQVAARLLREIGLPEGSTLSALPTSLDVKRARQRAEERARLLDEGERATRAVREREAALKTATKVLEGLPESSLDVSTLSDVLSEAHAEGSLDRELADAREAYDEAMDRTLAARRKLRLSDRPSDEFLQDGLPARAEIEAMSARDQAIQTRRAEGARETASATARLEAAERQRQALIVHERAPSEQELHEARTSRADVWALIQAAWRDGEDVTQRIAPLGLIDDRGLGAVFEEKTGAADDISDRLRLEAVAVARRRTVEEEIGETRRRLAVLAAEQVVLDGEVQGWAADWRALWRRSRIEPEGPSRMLGWLEAAETYVATEAAESRARDRLGAVMDRAARARATLCGALGLAPSDGASINALVTMLARLRDDALHANETRRTLRRDVELAGVELETLRAHASAAERAVAEQDARLSVAFGPLRLGASSDQSDVDHVAEQLAEAKRALDAVERYAEDQQARLARITDFERRVATESARQSLEAPAASSRELVVLLTAKLRTLEQNALWRGDLLKSIETERQNAATAESARVLAERELVDLCAEARVATVDDLPEAERLSAEYRQVETRLSEVETRLVRVGYGSVEEIEHDSAASTEEDDRAAALRESEAVARLETEERALGDRVAVLRSELARVQGADDAARASQDAAAALADIESSVSDYLRARLAQVILARRTDKYREENEAPMLKRASILFAELTGGSFAGLSILDDEAPRVVGVRPRGAATTSVEVDGMSEGTRDQLFLALRLAALEQRLSVGEPLPFLVDDILVNFDDERARLALVALADLSRKTQVLFFTHHARLVELARGLGDSQVFVHTL
jgi:uncharacterized protein YhaN